MAKTKITVVVDEAGTVIGTQHGHGDTADPATGVVLAVTAGPGQRLHKIEFEVPALRTNADVSKFHEQLEKHLKA